MDSHARVVVVGGGIFGVSTAWALASAGSSHVELCERNRLGSANTALAAGIVSLQTWNDEDAALILRTRRWIERLVEWGTSNDVAWAASVWKRAGGLTLAPPARTGVLETIAARVRRQGGTADMLDVEQARGRFPTLRFQEDEAILHSPDDGYVASTDLVELVRMRARSLGVQVREEASVARVETEDGRVRGIRFEDGRAQRADVVVVAGGAWTRSVLEASGVRAPLLAYRTQLCALASERAPPMVIHDAVNGFYARPESAQRFLAGDGTELRSFEPDRFDPRPSAAFMESIAAAVPRRIPDPDARWVNGWAGLCVGTPDRRPLAGPMPQVDGLHVLTGDNGFGVMRGLALGELVARGIHGAADPQAPGVDPARFGRDPPLVFPLGEGFSLPD